MGIDALQITSEKKSGDPKAGVKMGTEGDPGRKMNRTQKISSDDDTVRI